MSEIVVLIGWTDCAEIVLCYVCVYGYDYKYGKGNNYIELYYVPVICVRSFL
jgi:hypothetical protein